MASVKEIRDKVKQKRLSDLLDKHKNGKTTAAEVKELDLLLAEREAQEVDSTTEPQKKGWPCTITQISELFKVTKKTICDWVKKGMPKEAFSEYDFQKVFPWWYENINSGPEDKDETITEAKRRYWVEKATSMETKNKLLAGTMVIAKDIHTEWAQRAGDLRQTMLAIPSRMSPVLVGKSIDDIRIALRDEMLKLLEGFCREFAYSTTIRKQKKRKIRNGKTKKSRNKILAD